METNKIEEDNTMSDKYVWYACYGSNLLKERFMGYILGGGIKGEGGCRDKTPPIKEMQITISHVLYFSKRSSKRRAGLLRPLPVARKLRKKYQHRSILIL